MNTTQLASTDLTASLIDTTEPNRALATVPRRRLPSIFQRGSAATQRAHVPDEAMRDVFEHFWSALQRSDPYGVQEALAAVGGVQRLALVNRPRDVPKRGEPLSPQLPLCVAAYDGNAALVGVLLGVGAHPWRGDVDPESPETPAYLPAFWAATQGREAVLDLLYERQRSLVEARRGL